MKSHPIFQIKTKEIKIAQGHTFKTKKNTSNKKHNPFIYFF